MAKLVEIEHLCRDYEISRGAFRGHARAIINALVDVSLEFGEGEIFGILGPNGAGKTTLFRIIATLLMPTSGTVKVLGHDVTIEADRVKPHINFMFGGARGLYWRLSVWDICE